MAVLLSETDKRIHWLEAAARWLSLVVSKACYCQGKLNRDFGPHRHRETLGVREPLKQLTA